jgi:hypothetical protein
MTSTTILNTPLHILFLGATGYIGCDCAPHMPWIAHADVVSQWLCARPPARAPCAPLI